MNIGIDARLLERKITGIGRSLNLLLNEIPKVDKNNKYFLFSYGVIDVDKSFYTNITTVKIKLPQKLFSPIWNNFILPSYLKNNNIDILFSINQILPLVKVEGCKYISVVHDVIYKADPNFLPTIYRIYLQFFAYFSIKISDLIITVSEYSKEDILRYYNVDQKKIKVILQSASKDFKPMNLSNIEKEDFRRLYNFSKNLVLYVGMIENRKNIMGILKVADLMRNINRDVEFILVGKRGYGSNSILKEVKKRKNVKHLTNIDDTTLKKLYNVADIFLFPSFYEGFGYPPLEAMQCGLPVISANNTSLKEIIADGGILLDANDCDSMANEIIKLLADNNLSVDLSNKGIQRSKKFNIDTTVKELVNVFDSFKN